MNPWPSQTTCAHARVLEATHRTRPSFEMLMITLDRLLDHLPRDVIDLGERRTQCRKIGGRLVRRHCMRTHPRLRQRLGEERRSRDGVTRRAHVDVDDLPTLVHSAIGIAPLARDAHICIIDVPDYAHLVPVVPGRFLIE